MLQQLITVFLLGWLAGMVFFFYAFHYLEEIHDSHTIKKFVIETPYSNSKVIKLKSPEPSVIRVNHNLEDEANRNNLQSLKTKETDHTKVEKIVKNKESKEQQVNKETQQQQTILTSLPSTELVRPNKESLNYHSNKDSNDDIPLHHFPKNSNKGNKPWIFLDWSHDDRLFTAENYKALESLLNVYPKSTYRVILPTPNDAYVHKIGNSLSITHFSKYQRRGYNLEIFPVATLKSPNIEPGQAYWDKWSSICCKKCNARCRISDHVQPLHLMVYIRLRKLFKKGGISSDFTYLFLDHIQHPIKYGYTMSTTCDGEVPTLWQEEQERVNPGKWVLERCFTSMTIVINEEESPLVNCMLHGYNDTAFVHCVETDDLTHGAQCIRKMFDNCFTKLNVPNDLKENYAVEDWEESGSKAKESLIEWNEWKVSDSKRIIWMGDKATSAFWPADPFPEGTLFNAIVKSFSLWKATWEDPSSQCKAICHSYNSNPTLLKEFKTQSYGTGIEHASCAPTIIVPGFMKAASTFLFNAISSHPQVLPPLRGAQMKETYCYHASPLRKLMKRPWCFPYIEPGENYFNSDGTVYYATNPEVPMTLKEDNPNVKVVFAVRQPTDRFYSNYKFSFDTYGKKGPIDDLIDIGTNQTDKFGILRQMTMDEKSEEEIIDAYYNSLFNGGGALGVLFMHSINYPAILHYRKVLGKENVMVVRSEELDVKRPTILKETISRVYHFLGLCPHDPPSMDSKTLIGKNQLPKEKELSKEGYERLNTFFRPFNDALAALEGWNLTEWNYRHGKKSLPPSYNGKRRDKISPPTWFMQE